MLFSDFGCREFIRNVQDKQGDFVFIVNSGISILVYVYLNVLATHHGQFV